jgi:peptidoglycan/xylan/chitin deacetylase (PgdA/CDA1 family)
MLEKPRVFTGTSEENCKMSKIQNDCLYWPGGRKKAMTLSYDDGITQDIRLIKLFDTYRVKGTFNLNPRLFGAAGKVSLHGKTIDHIKNKPEEIQEIYKNYEIAGHGEWHTSMSTMDTARCANEILNCRRDLEGLLGRTITGFAYAFGVTSPKVREALKTSGVRYARTITSTGKFDIPHDFLMWDPTCHHDDEKLFDYADQFLSDKPYLNFETPVKLFYVWGHAYEFDINENWDWMEKFLQKVSGHEDVWYATNGEIERYVRAYRELVFTVDGKYVYNPSAIDVTLGGMFSDSITVAKAGETVRMAPPTDM